MFTPGTRVLASCGSVNLAFNHETGEYPYWEDEQIDGTVMSWSGEKLIVCLDESWHYDGRYHRKLWPDLLTLLDEAKVKACSICGHPLDRLEHQTYTCEECNPDIF
jgi:hypothetical protein